MTIQCQDIDWESYSFSEKAALTFIYHENEVLLIHKKRGLGKGKVNAPGGRLEAGELAIEAAVRESEEEVGLTPKNLDKRVELHFIFLDGYSLKVSVFSATSYTGELIETDEADPFWCPLTAIPYDEMWADDRYWIPAMCAGEKLRGFFIFDDDQMLDMHLESYSGIFPE